MKLKATVLILLSTFCGLNDDAIAQNLIWARQMGGGSNDNSNSVSVDINGNVFTAGTFTGTADFDPGPSSFNLSAANSTNVFVSKLDSSGNFLWAKQIGGTSSPSSFIVATAVAFSTVVDASGNVLTAGYFNDTADFDPGTGIYNLIAGTGNDAFISKLDASGNFVWAKQMGGQGGAVGRAIQMDSFGNIYVTGEFVSTVDFDPGIGIYNLTSSTNNGDVFVVKLDASGNFVWARQWGGIDMEHTYSIAVDAAGNVYTAGTFYGSVPADFDPGIGTYNMTPYGVFDIFISKLDASGNFLWAKQLGGAGSDYCFSIALDNNGNVYTTGEFNSTADFDPGAGIYNLIPTSSQYSVFISRLDSSGNFVWAKQMSGGEYSNAYSITIDAAGNVFTSGTFYGIVDFDPGPGTFNLNSGSSNNGDIFISKLDASGNFISAQQMGGANSDVAYSLEVKTNGNIYMTGHFKDTADFDPGSGIFNLISSGMTDIFVVKLSDIPTGIPDVQNAMDDPVIYPNPFSNSAVIRFRLNEAKKVSVKIFDAPGRLVRTIADGSFPVGENKIEWNTSDVNAGIYFLKIISDRQRFVSKIVKQ